MDMLGVASGARSPDAGRVLIGGQPLGNPDPARARRLGLATVYQDTSLVPELSVADNLFLAARVALPSGERPRFSERLRWATELLLSRGMELSPLTLVSELSPARRQFLEVIKALVG